MFFFFKQKTAYEMRISDWSSDVCSSDLPPHAPAGVPGWSELASSIASVCWMAVMSPGNALDRVVYLKDRALEESRRVAAYGQARDLNRELGADELVRRHGEGTLQELPGHGPETAQGMSQAADRGSDEDP